MSSPDNEWITIAEAVEVAGCTDGWLRMLLAKGDLKGWKAGQRAWLLRRSDAVALKNTLTIPWQAKPGPARCKSQKAAQTPLILGKRIFIDAC